MDVKTVIAAFDSDVRREILTVLHSGPQTVKEVLQELVKRNQQVRYRETVYRALEKLVDAHLVDKFYKKEHGLCYKLVSSQITIEIKSNSILMRLDND